MQEFQDFAARGDTIESNMETELEEPAPFEEKEQVVKSNIPYPDPDVWHWTRHLDPAHWKLLYNNFC
jgi:hypothetical protein